MKSAKRLSAQLRAVISNIRAAHITASTTNRTVFSPAPGTPTPEAIDAAIAELQEVKQFLAAKT